MTIGVLTIVKCSVRIYNVPLKWTTLLFSTDAACIAEASTSTYIFIQGTDVLSL